VLERRSKPLGDPSRLLARSEDVGGRDDSALARERQDLGGLFAAHEFRRAEVQEPCLLDLLPRRVRRSVRPVRPDDVEGGTRPVRADREHAG